MQVSIKIVARQTVRHETRERTLTLTVAPTLTRSVVAVDVWSDWMVPKGVSAALLALHPSWKRGKDRFVTEKVWLITAILLLQRDRVLNNSLASCQSQASKEREAVYGKRNAQGSRRGTNLVFDVSVMMPRWR